MTYLRISKYDPAIYNKDGVFFATGQWTEISDVGKVRGGKLLTLDEYIVVEEKYVSAAQQFIDILGIKQLSIDMLEMKSCEHIPKSLISECKRTLGIVAEGKTISIEEFPFIFRLLLRTAIWCRLSGENGFYVSMGYDYWMLLGYDGDNDISDQIVTDLFIEPYYYPFHDREEEDEDEGVDINELLAEDEDVEED